MDRDAIYARMQSAAERACPGRTPAQAMNEYLQTPAGRQAYSEYRAAPPVKRPAPAKPAPPSNPVWDVIEGKARAYAEQHSVTKEAAMVPMFQQNPGLYDHYLAARKFSGADYLSTPEGKRFSEQYMPKPATPAPLSRRFNYEAAARELGAS